jgi:hypothetical protein
MAEAAWTQDDIDDDQFDDGSCPECGDGDPSFGRESACIDDLCHGGDVPCMHGDYAVIPCGLCGK